MKQEDPKAPLGAASGYATATDAALDWFANPRANPHAVAKAIGHEGWPHAAHISMKAGVILAQEVARLRCENLAATAAAMNAEPVRGNVTADFVRLNWLDANRADVTLCWWESYGHWQIQGLQAFHHYSDPTGATVRSAIDAAMRGPDESPNEVAE